jgi:hypothetical protein
VPVRRLHACPHPLQGLGNPLEWTPAERLVPDQLEPSLLTGQDAREEPHQRPRVLAIDRAAGRPQSAQARPRDARSRPVQLDLGAERSHGGDGRQDVVGETNAANGALSVGDGCQQERAMRNRLVSRNGEIAAHRGCGLDVQDSSKAGETMTE